MFNSKGLFECVFDVCFVKMLPETERNNEILARWEKKTSQNRVLRCVCVCDKARGKINISASI